MLRLTLAQMRRSLGRLVAAAIAIAIGTAFVAATLLTGGVIKRASYDSVTASFAEADLVVDGDARGLLDAVRAVPGVVAADPIAVSGVQLRNGAAQSWQLLLPVASDPSLSSVVVTEGTVPTKDDEVAVPTDVARRLHVGIGDHLEVAWTTWSDGDLRGQGHTQQATVTGLTDDPAGAWTGYGGASLATFDAMVRWTGSADDIGGGGLLVAAPRDTAAVQARLATVTSAPVLTRDQAAEKTIRETGDGSNVVVGAILAFAAVALVVAALVISNTFQVIVAQRTRTLALLRCVGAVRGQLRRSVLVEAGILGLGASAVGVLLGTGVAQAALAVLGRVQDDMPLPDYVSVTPVVVLVPVLVGTVVTVLAALVPARAATRVAPVAALRPVDVPDVATRAGRLRLAFAALLFAGGTGLLVLAVVGAKASPGDAMELLALGILGGALSFVGVLVGAVFWVPRAVALVGRLLGRAGPTARLAAANTVRNPRRTAATSTALLIGVTLVALMSTGAASARTSMAAELDTHYKVDIELTSDDLGYGTTIADGVLQSVADVRGVEDAVEVPAMQVQVGDQWYTAYSVTPEVASVLRDQRIVDALRDDQVVVTHVGPTEPQRAVRVDGSSGLRVGDGEATVRLHVIESTTYGEAAYLTPTTFDAIAAGPVDRTTIWARIASDADASQVLDEVRDAVSDQPLAVESPVATRAQYEQVIDTLLAIVIGLLAVAVVIALVGVANTLSLSVIERRRESATLRAIGLTRRRLRLSLAAEGMLIAGVGAVFGILLGVLYGWAGASIAFGALGDAELVVPWRDVAAIVAIALGAGLLASVLPARSAVRTPPVAALAVD